MSCHLASLSVIHPDVEKKEKEKVEEEQEKEEGGAEGSTGLREGGKKEWVEGVNRLTHN